MGKPIQEKMGTIKWRGRGKRENGFDNGHFCHPFLLHVASTGGKECWEARPIILLPQLFGVAGVLKLSFRKVHQEVMGVMVIRHDAEKQ